jgi:hypothetical protein
MKQVVSLSSGYKVRVNGYCKQLVFGGVNIEQAISQRCRSTQYVRHFIQRLMTRVKCNYLVLDKVQLSRTSNI